MYRPPLIQNSAARLILVLNFSHTTLLCSPHWLSATNQSATSKSRCTPRSAPCPPPPLNVPAVARLCQHSAVTERAHRRSQDSRAIARLPFQHLILSCFKKKKKKEKNLLSACAVLHMLLFIYLDKTLQVLDDISLLLLRGLNALFVSCLGKKKKKPLPNECNVMQHTFHHLFISHLPPIPLIFI